MTTIQTLSVLAHQPAQGQIAMPQQQQPAGAGARVRITFDGVVQYTDGALITLVAGATLDTTAPGMHIATLEPGFQVADQVHDGMDTLFRVDPEDGPAYWISSGGRIVHDREIDPTRLRLLTRAGDSVPDASEAAQR